MRCKEGAYHLPGWGTKSIAPHTNAPRLRESSFLVALVRGQSCKTDDGVVVSCGGEDGRPRFRADLSDLANMHGRTHASCISFIPPSFLASLIGQRVCEAPGFDGDEECLEMSNVSKAQGSSCDICSIWTRTITKLHYLLWSPLLCVEL